MNRHSLKILVPGFVLAAALAFGAAATTPPTPVARMPPQADTTPLSAEMKAECKAMTAKYQEMNDRQAAMDITLDKLVEAMNAARTSTDPGALGRTMAAVVNELVAQRKVSRRMVADMQPLMMAHQMHHAGKNGTAGEMTCPMMTAMAPAKLSELQPKP
ncbi:MAG: hypothetical protein SF066_17445 [Thermoanaerobaculia bacterium]|nr:hypothetical protein [Thermoanaerobaculia bacterium]